MTGKTVATLVVTTFNRAERVTRAIDSALAQTVPCEVIVADHGSTDDTPRVVAAYGDRVRYVRREIDNGPFFCWLDGIIHATSSFVHITYDDDWIDPTFTARCLELFRDDCAFVFTAVEGHAEVGEPWEQYVDLFDTGVHRRSKVERALLRMKMTISPGCGFFRKADALQALLVGDLPLSTRSYHGVGPDLLLYLLPLLCYPRFGFVNERLAHFVAHRSSITVDARGDDTKRRQLISGYDEARNYYLALKYSKHSLRLGFRKMRLKLRRRLSARRAGPP